jgi:hypothetical protein
VPGRPIHVCSMSGCRRLGPSSACLCPLSISVSPVCARPVACCCGWVCPVSFSSCFRRLGHSHVSVAVRMSLSFVVLRGSGVRSGQRLLSWLGLSCVALVSFSWVLCPIRLSGRCPGLRCLRCLRCLIAALVFRVLQCCCSGALQSSPLRCGRRRFCPPDFCMCSCSGAL